VITFTIFCFESLSSPVYSAVISLYSPTFSLTVFVAVVVVSASPGVNLTFLHFP
jgi:hypothetical protein